MSRLAAPLLIGLTGIAILLALGTWQVQRLAWKRGILSDIKATIAAPTAPLPSMISPTEQRYQPVDLTGMLETETRAVLVSVKLRGAGWRLISAFETEDGRRVLVDRGYVPVEEKDTKRYAGSAKIKGNLHWPDDRNSSTPENDVAGNTWFARDIAALSEALQTEPLLVITRQMQPADPGVTPLPVDTGGIPNNHLQYAITWFSLAAIWLIMSAAWIWRQTRAKEI